MRDASAESISPAKRRKDARNHKTTKSNSVADIPNVKGRYVMSRKMLTRLKKKPNKSPEKGIRHQKQFTVSCFTSFQIIFRFFSG